MDSNPGTSDIEANTVATIAQSLEELTHFIEAVEQQVRAKCHAHQAIAQGETTPGADPSSDSHSF